MAVKIGTTTGTAGAGTITLTQDADEDTAFSEEYGVGNYADNMKIAIDDNDTIYTVTDNDSGTLSITPVLSDDVAADTDVFKVYEGAHGTVSEHLRKRLLGYI
ncbi:MAG: hypothetical protein CL816_01645 [Coxiellaceae bacterium]|nr:hypothetical protein [Coxiellaceae bacterium]